MFGSLRAVSRVAAVVVAVLAVPGVSVPTQAGGDLDGLEGIEVPVSMNYPDAPLAMVFEALGKVANFSVSFDPEPPTTRVDYVRNDLTVRDVLEDLADRYDLEYDIPASDQLVVLLPDE